MDEAVRELVTFLKQTSYLKYEEYVDQLLLITKEGHEAQMGTHQFRLIVRLLDKLEPQWRKLPEAQY